MGPPGDQLPGTDALAEPTAGQAAGAEGVAVRVLTLEHVVRGGDDAGAVVAARSGTGPDVRLADLRLDERLRLGHVATADTGHPTGTVDPLHGPVDDLMPGAEHHVPD